MLWVLGALVVFFGLAWVGKQSRLGRFRPGPWINQFRTLRSVISMGLVVLGVTMLMKGLMVQGLIALFIAFILGGSVRYQTYFRRDQTPPAAASYTPEEIKAYGTLGLSIGSDRKAVKAAWKRLMKTAHPDQGGSDAQASALNAARDVLLRRRR